MLNSLRAQGEAVATRLADAANLTTTAVNAHADVVVARISSSNVDAVEALRSHGGAVASRLEDAVAAIRAQGDAVAAQLADATNSTRTAVGAHADAIVGRIYASNERVLNSIRTSGQDVADRLAKSADLAASAVGAHFDAVAGRINSSSADAVEALQAHGDGVTARLAEAAEAVRTHGDIVSSRLADASHLLRDAIDSHADKIVGRLNAKGAETVETFNAQSKSLAGRLIEATDALARDFGERALALIDRVDHGRRG